MTPPQAPEQGIAAAASETPAAVSLCPNLAKSPVLPETLKNRPDFLRAAQARRQGTASFLLQARARGDASAAVRVGFTASKKIGNAVARNRAKRRMRALMREVLPALAKPGWDYVLVARPDATTMRDYAEMRRDLETALRSVHQDRALRPAHQDRALRPDHKDRAP